MNGIRWPGPEVQRRYTGGDGEVLLKRTVDFVEKLISAAPIIETSDWKGLEYGVGFGRVASLLSLFGKPDQLTCVDAWERSLILAKSSGLKNPMYLVNPILKIGELPEKCFDFVYAYSIFTHLPQSIFLNNVEKIVASLKPGGVFIFTVREQKFAEWLKHLNNYNTVVDELSTSGYWFGNAQSQYYGDTIVSDEWITKNLSQFGAIENIGVTNSDPLQLILALRVRSA